MNFLFTFLFGCYLEVLASDLFNDSFSRYLSTYKVPSESISSLEDDDLVQGPYSFRCIPIETFIMPYSTFIRGVKYFKLVDTTILQLEEFDDEAQFEKVLDSFESCLEISIQTE